MAAAAEEHAIEIDIRDAPPPRSWRGGPTTAAGRPISDRLEVLANPHPRPPTDERSPKSSSVKKWTVIAVLCWVLFFAAVGFGEMTGKSAEATATGDPSGGAASRASDAAMLESCREEKAALEGSSSSSKSSKSKKSSPSKDRSVSKSGNSEDGRRDVRRDLRRRTTKGEVGDFDRPSTRPRKLLSAECEELLASSLGGRG